MEIVENQVLIEHRWLYSVVPLFGGGGGIFLVGYCKNCDTAFSTDISTGEKGEMVLEKAGVPKYGCQ